MIKLEFSFGTGMHTVEGFSSEDMLTGALEPREAVEFVFKNVGQIQKLRKIHALPKKLSKTLSVPDTSTSEGFVFSVMLESVPVEVGPDAIAFEDDDTVAVSRVVIQTSSRKELNAVLDALELELGTTF